MNYLGIFWLLLGAAVICGGFSLCGLVLWWLEDNGEHLVGGLVVGLVAIALGLASFAVLISGLTS